MADRPTRQHHLDQCARYSIALVDFVREMHRRYKFFVDEWQPEPYDETAYQKWAEEEVK